jgi:hypothetical protein
MAKLKKVSAELVKTDEGIFYTQNLRKLNILLEDLLPGRYKLTIEKVAPRLDKMKKFYFSMESSLSAHLGIKKSDLHKGLMKVFTTFDEHEKEVYASVADIKSEQEMMTRIIEFQEYAAREHGYRMEPFVDD